MSNSNVSPSSNGHKNGHKKRGSFTLQQSLEGKQLSNAPPDLTSKSLAGADTTSRGRVAIFIDAASLFRAALQLGFIIDYSRLLTYLIDGDRLLRSFFYIGIDPTNMKQQGFLLWMRRNGYRVIEKELTQHPDGSKKASVGVEIAVDMLSLIGYYDTAVLIGGNDDLTYAVNAVSYKGVRVEVVGLRSMTSESLVHVADHYIDLDQIKEQIQKIF